MARPSIYRNPRRVNVIIETDLHDEGVDKAKVLKLRGGFSEYVARLIVADRKRKGRAILSQQRAA